MDVAKQRDRARVGKLLGYEDQTAVYRYLNDKREGDLKKFEKRLASFISNELRIEGGGELVDDSKAFVLPAVFAFLKMVLKYGMINVGYGDAGTGKTCGARLFARMHKETTIYTHVWTWSCSKAGLAAELVKSAGIDVKGDEHPTQALARHFRDSQKMFIIDNAQRLTASARNWLCDFMDYTGASIALFGNPEIKTQWSKNDQHSRRVGLQRDISIDLFDEDPKRNTSEATLNYLMKQHLPDAATNKTVRAEALKIITGKRTGSCGAFVQHARLTRLLMESGMTDAARAFQSAATQLIKAA